MARHRIIIPVLTLIASLLAASAAHARCERSELAEFLNNRAFELTADEKIELYAERLVRYYDKRDLSKRKALASMRAWEARWPERIYKVLSITDYKETDTGDACKVTFDYRFLAYSPNRDKISAGIGETTLVLAVVEGADFMKIIGEVGTVKCRGLKRFARSRC